MSNEENNSIENILWKIYSNQENSRFNSKEKLKESFNVNLIMIEKYIAEMRSNSFDLIIASNILHFIPGKKHAINALQKLVKCLKKNGFIYVDVANEKHKFHSNNNRSTFNIIDFQSNFEKSVDYLKTRRSY